jgi:hypothetical protein
MISLPPGLVDRVHEASRRLQPEKFALSANPHPEPGTGTWQAILAVQGEDGVYIGYGATENEAKADAWRHRRDGPGRLLLQQSTEWEK